MTESVITTAAPAPARASSRSNLAIGLLLAATFTVFLNETLLSVAIPKIMGELQITATLGQWLTTAYALTMAVVIPITGWLLERVNTRPVFILAMILFSLGTLLAALSPSFPILVTARVIQASGTAIMMPLLMTTVLELVPHNDRGRMMGLIGIVMSVAPAIGPAISGLVLQWLPWRSLFWIVLPIAVAMLVIGIARVPNVGDPRKVPLDAVSVVLSAIGFAGVVYGLSTYGQQAEGDALALAPWIPLVIGIAALALFVWRQLTLQKGDRAFLDLRTFKARTFTMSTVMLAISMVALFGTFFILPIYLQSVLHQPTWVVGVLLLPGGLLMGVMGPIVGRLYDRFGPKPLLIPGAIIVTGVLVSLSFVSETTSPWAILAAHLVLSVGLGLVFTPLFTAGTGALPSHLYSHGAAIISTLQQVAGAAGTALFVAFYALGIAAAGAVDADTATVAQLASGTRLGFLVAAIASVGAVVAAFFIQKPAHEELSDEELEAGESPYVHGA